MKSILVKSIGVLMVSLNQVIPVTYCQGKLYYENPVLFIPKIDLKKEMYPNDDKLNNVDKNIQVIEGSKMPDYRGGNLILASHSGSADISYFKHLDEVSINDSVYVYYKNKKYNYVIMDIYDVLKTGYVSIKRDRDKSTITLITCKKNTNKQIVLIGYLSKAEAL